MKQQHGAFNEPEQGRKGVSGDKLGEDGSEVGSRISPIQKALRSPKSLRAAINAKCYECSGFYRPEVTACEAYNCPLWNLRPWQRKGESK